MIQSRQIKLMLIRRLIAGVSMKLIAVRHESKKKTCFIRSNNLVEIQHGVSSNTQFFKNMKVSVDADRQKIEAQIKKTYKTSDQFDNIMDLAFRAVWNEVQTPVVTVQVAT